MVLTLNDDQNMEDSVTVEVNLAYLGFFARRRKLSRLVSKARWPRDNKFTVRKSMKLMEFLIHLTKLLKPRIYENYKKSLENLFVFWTVGIFGFNWRRVDLNLTIGDLKTNSKGVASLNLDLNYKNKFTINVGIALGITQSGLTDASFGSTSAILFRFYKGIINKPITMRYLKNLIKIDLKKEKGTFNYDVSRFVFYFFQNGKDESKNMWKHPENLNNPIYPLMLPNSSLILAPEGIEKFEFHLSSDNLSPEFLEMKNSLTGVASNSVSPTNEASEGARPNPINTDIKLPINSEPIKPKDNLATELQNNLSAAVDALNQKEPEVPLVKETYIDVKIPDSKKPKKLKIVKKVNKNRNYRLIKFIMPNDSIQEENLSEFFLISDVMVIKNWLTSSSTSIDNYKFIDDSFVNDSFKVLNIMEFVPSYVTKIKMTYDFMKDVSIEIFFPDESKKIEKFPIGWTINGHINKFNDFFVKSGSTIDDWSFYDQAGETLKKHSYYPGTISIHMRRKMIKIEFRDFYGNTIIETKISKFKKSIIYNLKRFKISKNYDKFLFKDQKNSTIDINKPVPFGVTKITASALTMSVPILFEEESNTDQITPDKFIDKTKKFTLVDKEINTDQIIPDKFVNTTSKSTLVDEEINTDQLIPDEFIDKTASKKEITLVNPDGEEKIIQIDNFDIKLSEIHSTFFNEYAEKFDKVNEVFNDWLSCFYYVDENVNRIDLNNNIPIGTTRIEMKLRDLYDKFTVFDINGAKHEKIVYRVHFKTIKEVLETYFKNAIDSTVSLTKYSFQTNKGDVLSLHSIVPHDVEFIKIYEKGSDLIESNKDNNLFTRHSVTLIDPDNKEYPYIMDLTRDIFAYSVHDLFSYAINHHKELKDYLYVDQNGFKININKPLTRKVKKIIMLQKDLRDEIKINIFDKKILSLTLIKDENGEISEFFSIDQIDAIKEVVQKQLPEYADSFDNVTCQWGSKKFGISELSLVNVKERYLESKNIKIIFKDSFISYNGHIEGGASLSESEFKVYYFTNIKSISNETLRKEERFPLLDIGSSKKIDWDSIKYRSQEIMNEMISEIWEKNKIVKSGLNLNHDKSEINILFYVIDYRPSKPILVDLDKICYEDEKYWERHSLAVAPELRPYEIFVKSLEDDDFSKIKITTQTTVSELTVVLGAKYKINPKAFVYGKEILYNGYKKEVGIFALIFSRKRSVGDLTQKKDRLLLEPHDVIFESGASYIYVCDTRKNSLIFYTILGIEGFTIARPSFKTKTIRWEKIFKSIFKENAISEEEMKITNKYDFSVHEYGGKQMRHTDYEGFLYHLNLDFQTLDTAIFIYISKK